MNMMARLREKLRERMAKAKEQRKVDRCRMEAKLAELKADRVHREKAEQDRIANGGWPGTGGIAAFLLAYAVGLLVAWLAW